MTSGQNAKRSFKIDFDKYQDKQNFRGFSKLNLNSGVMDASKIREPLAYVVFRGAPVFRPVETAFAEVNLTVPGKYDREYLGLYAVIEHVDKGFLTAHFKNAKGLLLKPEGIRGIPYLGEDLAAYAKPFNIKVEDEGSGLKRLLPLPNSSTKRTKPNSGLKSGIPRHGFVYTLPCGQCDSCQLRRVHWHGAQLLSVLESPDTTSSLSSLGISIWRSVDFSCSARRSSKSISASTGPIRAKTS